MSNATKSLPTKNSPSLSRNASPEQSPEKRTEILLIYLLGLTEKNAISGFQIRLLFTSKEGDNIDGLLFVRKEENGFAIEALVREERDSTEFINQVHNNMPNTNINEKTIDILSLKETYEIIRGAIPLMGKTDPVRIIIMKARSAQDQKTEDFLRTMLGGQIELECMYAVPIDIRDTLASREGLSAIAPIFFDVTTRLGFVWS